MVRSIVGTVLDLAPGEAPVAAFREALEARDRRRAGTTAPARGLFLQTVHYDDAAAS
jgi:tRNA pseudouridine38-40 synthase